MTTNSLLSKISDWLKSIEVFKRPRKKIVGKWQLYEYFVDKEDELLHFNEEDLKVSKQSVEIEFLSAGTFSLLSTIPIKQIKNLKKGSWGITRNYVTFRHPDNFRESVDFQIAFDNDTFKMLKKDQRGKIEFFGLFRKLTSDC